MLKKIAVLGAGPGGYVAALRAAQLGAEVTLVEQADLGGTCLNAGCIPSKVLEAAAERFEKLRRASDFGLVLEGNVRLDMGLLQKRKEQILQIQREGIEALLRRGGVRFVQGVGRVPRAGSVDVERVDGTRERFAWDNLIVATGSRPLELPGVPFDGHRILSSDDILSIREAPRSLVIVGGGVIGCEFATIFSAFGTEVTLVETLERLLPLPSVDEDSSKVLQRELKKRRIKVYLHHMVRDIEEKGEELLIRLESLPLGDAGVDRSSTAVTAERVLVCIGRIPNTEGIGLDALGVKRNEKGWIRADGKMRTNVRGVYAVGDVLGPERIMLAHVASREGIVAAENALGGEGTVGYESVPNAIFTSPQVAGVGMTEVQARESGNDVRSDTFLFRNIGKPHVLGEIAGHVKIISEQEGGRILGIHMVGPGVTELIAEAALAIEMGCTVAQLSRTVHPHPTLSEVMQEASFRALDRGIHG